MQYELELYPRARPKPVTAYAGVRIAGIGTTQVGGMDAKLTVEPPPPNPPPAGWKWPTALLFELAGNLASCSAAVRSRLRLTMKPAALIVATICLMAFTTVASAQSVPLEPEASIVATKAYPRSVLLSLIDPGVGMIRARGWRCDSISVVRPFVWSRGFTIICNHYRYEYDFEDRGGNWVVELQ